jgi:hypothetical protein
MWINLICKNDECINFDIAIPFQNPAEIVICGPCGNEITDKEPVAQPKK